MSGYMLTIDGCPDAYATPGVAPLLGWTVYSYPTDQTLLEGHLARPTERLSARLRPLEGDCEVTPLSFVLHDLDNAITSRHVRDLDTIQRTTLTAAVTASATTITVASASGISIGSRLWIGRESLLVVGVSGTTLSVLRGRLGTRARAHQHDPARGVVAEVYREYPGMLRQRCTLWRVEQGIATPVYAGYCAHAPRLNTDGASWTISTVHARTVELASAVLGEHLTARGVGYDCDTVIATVRYGDRGIRTGPTIDPQRRIYPSLDALLARVCSDMRTALIALGAMAATTNVTYARSSRGLSITATAPGLGAFEVEIETPWGSESAQSQTVGATQRCTVQVPAEDTGSTTAIAWFAYGASGLQTGDRYTVLSPDPSLDTSSAAWASVAIAGDYTTTVTPILRSQYDNDRWVELWRENDAVPFWILNDTTRVAPAHTIVRASPVIRERDSQRVQRPPHVWRELRSRTVWARALDVRSQHWLWALRALYAADLLQSESDPRDWDWDYAIARAARSTAGVSAAVRWTLTSDRRVGEWLVDECALRGACLSVRGPRLTIVAIEPPPAHSTPVLTITDADLVLPPQVEQWEDGVVTAVTIASPQRDITVIDAVARARYGEGRRLELRAEGSRDNDLALLDPVQWARATALRPLRLWGQPVLLARLTLTALARGVELGDIVSITSATLAASGERGLVARRAVVVGRSESLDTGEIEIEALLLPVARGYAACARVASISGNIVTFATGYAGTASDYAGSPLTGYEWTPNDRGARTFATGDAVELVLRDSLADVRESAVVDSVLGTGVKLTSAPTNSAWSTPGAIIDLRTREYSAATSTQRDRWQFVSDGAEIVSGVPTRRWAP